MDDESGDDNTDDLIGVNFYKAARLEPPPPTLQTHRLSCYGQKRSFRFVGSLLSFTFLFLFLFYG